MLPSFPEALKGLLVHQLMRLGKIFLVAARKIIECNYDVKIRGGQNFAHNYSERETIVYGKTE